MENDHLTSPTFFLNILILISDISIAIVPKPYAVS